MPLASRNRESTSTLHRFARWILAVACVAAAGEDGLGVAAAFGEQPSPGQGNKEPPELIVPEEHLSPILGLAFDDNARHLLVGDAKLSIVEWDLTTMRISRRVGASGSGALCVAFGPDRKHALAATDETEAVVLDVASGKTLQRFSTAPSTLTAAAFGAKRGRILTADMGRHGVDVSGRVILWDVPTGKRVRTWNLDANFAQAVAMSPDGTGVAAGGGRYDLDPTASTAKLILWDLASGKPLHEWRWGRQFELVLAVAFSADGKALLAATDYRAKLYDVGSGKVRRVFQGVKGPLGLVAFSPDGKRVAAGGGYRLGSPPSGALADVLLPEDSGVWEVATGKLLHTLPARGLHTSALAFTPDGRYLAAGGGGMVRIWASDTGKELLRLIAAGGGRDYLAVTLEGYYQASSGARKLIRWRTGSEEIRSERFNDAFDNPDKVRRALRSER